MKERNIKLRIFLFILLSSITGIYTVAQVTIGSDIEPNRACLLDMKTIDVKNPVSVNDISNATVDAERGGLGLPRVQLVDLTTLEPFIPVDADWDANTGKIKECHAGLTVYNIKVSDPNEPDKNKTFSQGLYVWDGSMWRLVKDDNNNKRYFYMPSCFIDLTGKTPATAYNYDLYGEYKRQFTRAGNPQFVSSNSSLSEIPSIKGSRVYLPSELDYVISYYDPNIIEKFVAWIILDESKSASQRRIFEKKYWLDSKGVHLNETIYDGACTWRRFAARAQER